MTLVQFNDGLARYRRSMQYVLGLTGLAVAGYALAATVFRDRLWGWGAWLFGEAHAGLVMQLALVPVAAVMLGGAAWAQWAASRDPRLVCPNCGRLLAYGAVRLVVVATRRCPLCGERAIEDSGGALGYRHGQRID